jgi:hypothetical protein
MGEVFDFASELQRAEDPKHDHLWEQAYQRAFPNLVLISQRVPFRADLPSPQAQHLGQDRLIHLGNGTTLYLDEKAIRKHDPQGCFLEYLHTADNSAANPSSWPGWIEKSLKTDFIVYGYIPYRTFHFLPWSYLRAAWLVQKKQWCSDYGRRGVPNRGYHTHGVCVPVQVLREVCPVQTVIL